MEQLIVSFHDRNDPLPRPTLVVRPKTPVTKESLLQKLGGAAAGQDAAEVLTGNNGWSYFLPANEKGGVLVIGRPEEIKEISDARGAPPVIPVAHGKAAEDVGRPAARDRLAGPQRIGHQLLPRRPAVVVLRSRAVREPVDWFLGDAQAAMFSVHVADVTYVELMFLRRLGTASGSPVEAIQDRLRQMPERVERYIASLDPPPYWRVVALRYPQMVRYLYGQSRVGAEGDLTVVNAALPAAACDNLVFATEMALTSAASAGHRGSRACPAPQPVTHDRTVTITHSVDSRFPRNHAWQRIKSF